MHKARGYILLLLASAIMAISWKLLKLAETPRASSPENQLSQSLPTAPDGTRTNLSGVDPALAKELAVLEAREQHFRDGLWANEILAQEHGRIVESWWDVLNVSTNKLRAARSVVLGSLKLPRWETAVRGPHGVDIFNPTGASASLDEPGWKSLLAGLEADGWQLENVELRQVRFDPPRTDRGASSTFYFAARLTWPRSEQRAMLEGEVQVDWGADRTPDGLIPPAAVDASRLVLTRRQGPLPFVEAFSDTLKPPVNSYSIDPLIVRDLDGDGYAEIILAALNLVYRRKADGAAYNSSLLCRHAPGLLTTALVDDFDGDGMLDFLYHKIEGLFVIKGTPGGGFDSQPIRCGPSSGLIRFTYPMVMTSGDVDADGDLDVFMAQYRVSYENGSMAAPYYDAKDGYPACLLLNNGSSVFQDATAQAGLAQKRNRRTFAASFADLDADSDLDLAVVSDYAGIDVYTNDGAGHFADVTQAWIDLPQAFGMAHALADYNGDGILDLFMAGMTSPTADRLRHLNLWREDPAAPADRLMRAQLVHGNRLYLGQQAAGFAPDSAAQLLASSIARSGWSWGCSAFDFDNDGDEDVYQANGLESRDTVRDYESEYWLHDRYVGNSSENPAADVYFRAKFGRTRGRGQSYGGWEKNRFFVNLEGHSFIETGHLFGLGFEEDSRNVVATDLDSDGQPDLVVTGFRRWPDPRQTLRVFRNIGITPGHWIGFRFGSRPGTGGSAGVTVRLQSGARRFVRQIVNGDSYRSQHPPTIHFGLGDNAQVDRAEISWPGGGIVTLRNLEVNRYHFVSE